MNFKETMFVIVKTHVANKCSSQMLERPFSIDANYDRTFVLDIHVSIISLEQLIGQKISSFQRYPSPLVQYI